MNQNMETQIMWDSAAAPAPRPGAIINSLIGGRCRIIRRRDVRRRFITLTIAPDDSDLISDLAMAR